MKIKVISYILIIVILLNSNSFADSYASPSITLYCDGNNSKFEQFRYIENNEEVYVEELDLNYSYYSNWSDDNNSYYNINFLSSSGYNKIDLEFVSYNQDNDSNNSLRLSSLIFYDPKARKGDMSNEVGDINSLLNYFCNNSFDITDYIEFYNYKAVCLKENHPKIKDELLTHCEDRSNEDKSNEDRSNYVIQKIKNFFSDLLIRIF